MISGITWWLRTSKEAMDFCGNIVRIREAFYDLKINYLRCSLIGIVLHLGFL